MNRTESDDVSVEAIRLRAHQLFQARGAGEGHAWDDWLRAETELQREREQRRSFRRELWELLNSGNPREGGSDFPPTRDHSSFASLVVQILLDRSRVEFIEPTNSSSLATISATDRANQNAISPS